MTTTTATLTASEEEELVRQNIPMVRRAVAELASRMPRHAPREDLLSAGMVGLAQAARNYDPTRGVPFHRYAATRVKGALLDELRANDWASRPVRAKARQMDGIAERFTAEMGRAPTKQELAGAMGVAVDTVHALNQDLHRAVVLNYDAMLTNDGEGIALPGTTECPEDTLLDRERNAYLVDAVRALPERLRTVVIGYFFEDRSMQDLGAELGVSESRVSQLRAEALELLRDGINSQLDPVRVQQPAIPGGRVARRKEAYYQAIASSSTPQARIDARPRFAGLAATA